jgi:energy-coupling factor transporter ATP-binding protein EcfA2
MKTIVFANKRFIQDLIQEAAMLNATHLTKRFGRLIAVNDLSFEVQKGQIYGIAGPNGAGKSTVYNLITGFYDYEGKIEFDGKNITGLPPYRIAKASLPHRQGRYCPDFSDSPDFSQPQCRKKYLCWKPFRRPGRFRPETRGRGYSLCRSGRNTFSEDRSANATGKEKFNDRCGPCHQAQNPDAR